MPKPVYYRDIPQQEDNDDDQDAQHPHHQHPKNIQVLNVSGGKDEEDDYHPYQTPTLRGEGYGGGGSTYRRRPDIQSHNYEPDESEVWRAHVKQVHFSNRGQWWTTDKKRALKRWVLTFLIGVLQAIVATTCNFCSRSMSNHKFESVYKLLHPTTDDDAVVETYAAAASAWWAFSSFLLYQTGYAAIASIFVWIEPASGGSGIPEIKCFLNGIDLPSILRVKTLICKVVGVAFSVAAGLPIGKEGPMVHSGAIVSAAVSQGKSRFWEVDSSFSKFSDFRNDKEKRDFVACGAAAGVCSAFGSPIGGVLFSMEEASSYFSTKLAWYVCYRLFLSLVHVAVLCFSGEPSFVP